MLSYFLSRNVEASAADAAAQFEFMALWLLVGVVGLAIGFVLVIVANRQFQRGVQTHAVAKSDLNAHDQGEPAYRSAAA